MNDSTTTTPAAIATPQPDTSKASAIAEEPLIRASGIVKSFVRAGTPLPVLQGVELRVKPREVVLIAGPSGSGKSTLLAILGGLLTPDDGQVVINGSSMYQLSTRDRAKLRSSSIGYIFQRCHLIQGLTAAENVMMVAALHGLRPPVAKQLAARLLNAVGLQEHADAPTNELSLGQCQRVAVARSLAANPSVLLADEPTASLDRDNGREVVELIRQLGKRDGRCAIIVTHDHRVFPFADRVLWVENGTIQEAPPEQVSL